MRCRFTDAWRPSRTPLWWDQPPFPLSSCRFVANSWLIALAAQPNWSWFHWAGLYPAPASSASPSSSKTSIWWRRTGWILWPRPCWYFFCSRGTRLLAAYWGTFGKLCEIWNKWPSAGKLGNHNFDSIFSNGGYQPQSPTFIAHHIKQRQMSIIMFIELFSGSFNESWLLTWRLSSYVSINICS